MYLYIYTYIYKYLLKLIKAVAEIFSIYFSRAMFRFLPSHQRLNKITKSVKSINMRND